MSKKSQHNTAIAEAEDLCEEQGSVFVELPAILPRIYKGPASLPRALTDDEVPIYRQCMCRYYSACLTKASKWSGFTCIGCPVFGDKNVLITQELFEEAAMRSCEDK